MMRFFEVDGRRYGQFQSLFPEPGLTHAFSTRPFDVSLATGEKEAQCAAHRQQMASDFGFDPENLRCCAQVHGDRVAVVEETRAERRLEGFDAAVTNVPSVPLMVFSADCPLLLVYDPNRLVLGLAHASWRSTVAQITCKLVETMRDCYGCEPGGLKAGIGPSAGPQRYEVQNDVYRAAANLPDRDRLFKVIGGRMYLDLWKANSDQLLSLGVPAENIELAGICTISRTDLFYSYRKEGKACGRFCLLAGLRPPAGNPC